MKTLLSALALVLFITSLSNPAQSFALNRPPIAPALRSPTQGEAVDSRSIYFSWNVIADPDSDLVESYLIIRKAGQAWEPHFPGDIGFATSYRVSNLQPNTDYEWAVASVDWNQRSNPWYTFSAPKSFQTTSTSSSPAQDTVNAFSWNYTSQRWEQFFENSVVWITPDPLMPWIAARDLVTGGSRQPSTTMWQFRSQYNRQSSRNIDSRAFPSSGYIGITYGQFWYPTQQYFGNQFFGGNASFKFTDNVTTSVRNFPFKIRGKNPSSTVVRSYISLRSGPYYAFAIIKHESGFRQFYSSGTYSGEPLLGAPDGWGLAQLDYSSQGKTANTMEVWNWQVNLSSGLSIIQNKRQIASDYFAYIKRTYPRQWVEPPTYYHDPRTRTSFTYMDAAAITLYNGAPVLIQSGGVYYLSCWKFSPSNAAETRWTFVPNRNDYLYKIALEIESGS